MRKETNEHPKKEWEKQMRQNQKKKKKKDIRKNVQNLNITLLGLRVILFEKAKLVFHPIFPIWGDR